MSNHPNRSRHARTDANPAPEEIKALRLSAGLSQTEAAELVYAGLRTWQSWESDKNDEGHRRMNPAIWELFRIKVAARTVTEAQQFINNITRPAV